jgi:hypothetical protein
MHGIPPPPQAQEEVLVNQEGSLDLPPSGNSSPHQEIGPKVQSLERNDLQLVIANDPSEIPNWLEPFETTQLRNLLSATISPPQTSSSWFSNSGPNTLDASFTPAPEHPLLPALEQMESALVQSRVISKFYSRNKNRKMKEQKDSRESLKTVFEKWSQNSISRIA